jgi:hypothetical protein
MRVDRNGVSLEYGKQGGQVSRSNMTSRLDVAVRAAIALGASAGLAAPVPAPSMPFPGSVPELLFCILDL